MISSPSDTTRTIIIKTMTSQPHNVSPMSSQSYLPDLNNASERNDLMLDLYSYFQKNPDQSNNIHHKNGHVSKLIFVPVCTTASSFRKIGQKVIDDVIKHMSHEKENDTYIPESKVAEHVMKYLVAKHPHCHESISENSASKFRLTPSETSALIEFSDITEDTAYEKINRFFHNVRDMNILAPKRELHSFTNDIPSIKHYCTTVDCSTKKEKKIQTAEGIEITMHDSIKQKMQTHDRMLPDLAASPWTH